MTKLDIDTLIKDARSFRRLDVKAFVDKLTFDDFTDTKLTIEFLRTIHFKCERMYLNYNLLA